MWMLNLRCQGLRDCDWWWPCKTFNDQDWVHILFLYHYITSDFVRWYFISSIFVQLAWARAHTFISSSLDRVSISQVSGAIPVWWPVGSVAVAREHVPLPKCWRPVRGCSTHLHTLLHRDILRDPAFAQSTAVRMRCLSKMPSSLSNMVAKWAPWIPNECPSPFVLVQQGLNTFLLWWAFVVHCPFPLPSETVELFRSMSAFAKRCQQQLHLHTTGIMML